MNCKKSSDFETKASIIQRNFELFDKKIQTGQRKIEQ